MKYAEIHLIKLSTFLIKAYSLLEIEEHILKIYIFY